MSATVACPGCAKTLSIPAHAVGKRLACPFCRTILNATALLLPAEEHMPEIGDVEVVDDGIRREPLQAEVGDDEEEAGGTYGFDPADRVAKGQEGRTRARIASELGVLSLGIGAGPARCLAIAHDNRLGLAASGESIFILDLGESKKLRRFEKQETPVTCMATSRDGELVLSGDDSGGLLLWELRTGRALRWLEGHDGDVTSVAFAPNGRYAVSAGDDGTTRLWELAIGRAHKLFGARWDHAVQSVSYSPDGRYILAAGGSRVRIWSVKTGEVLRKFRGASGTVVSAAYSKDGTEVTACALARMSRTGLKVWRWSVETAKPLPAFTDANPNRASVMVAVVVPGGDRILTAGKKGASKAPASETGTNVAVSVIGSVVGTLAVRAMGGDGVVVVTAGSGGAPGPDEDPYCLQLWNAAGGMISHSYDAGEYPTTTLAVSPDGSRALSACRDGTVHVWGLPM
jgi:WD40 repeat protein